MEVIEIPSEDLGLWFLRLNGFLTIQNFVVHPDEGIEQATDVDVLGVRFPHRAENRKTPMPDYALFSGMSKTLVALTEIKTGQCRLNGPWTDSRRENLQKVLFALGAFPHGIIEDVAACVYASGYFEDRQTRLSIICLGESHNSGLQRGFPDVPQILWSDIKRFIYERFRSFIDVKRFHTQWDEWGHLLWDHAMRAKDVEEFNTTLEVVSPSGKS